jgi:hypothetical protein
VRCSATCKHALLQPLRGSNNVSEDEGGGLVGRDESLQTQRVIQKGNPEMFLRNPSHPALGGCDMDTFNPSDYPEGFATLMQVFCATPPGLTWPQPI